MSQTRSRDATPTETRTADDSGASEEHGTHDGRIGVLHRAVEVVRRKWAERGAGDEADVDDQIAALARMTERRSLGEEDGVDGQATALRLRLLGEIRRALLDTHGNGATDDPGDVLGVLGTLESVQEALEKDWARRFGLSLAGPSGIDVAAEIAHGLRSSCTSLLFAAEVLREGMYGELNAKQQQHVEILYGGALGLGTGLGDITELSWRTREVGGDGPETFSLEDTVAAVHRLLLPIAQARGTTFSLSVRAEPCRTGYPRPLRQALLHLALSGLMETEGGAIDVSVEDVKDGEGIRVAIDVSPGDATPEPDSEPFRILRERVNGDDYAFSTSALRLHMANELVHCLGGELRYEKRPDGSISTVFSILLPTSGSD